MEEEVDSTLEDRDMAVKKKVCFDTKKEFEGKCQEYRVEATVHSNPYCIL